MIRKVKRELATNLSIQQVALTKAHARMRGHLNYTPTLRPGQSVGQYDEEQAKMLRCMLRHIQQAYIKSTCATGNGSSPAWLLHLQLDDMSILNDNVDTDYMSTTPKKVGRKPKDAEADVVDMVVEQAIELSNETEETIEANIENVIKQNEMIKKLKDERASIAKWTFEFSWEQLTLTRISTKKKD